MKQLTTSQVDALRNDLFSNAQNARVMAVFCETDNPNAARAWHALADRLFEALDQADNMDKVITPSRP